jgi:hypothetical protein
MQLQGNRLGSAYEEEGYANNKNNENSKNNKNTKKKNSKDDDIPKPRVDPKLTDSDRIRQRDERLAAVEQRMKQNNPQSNNNKQKKKKKDTGAAPLKGPNSEPLMRWNA